nr:hypothetical protein [Tanacetum cinerariifolium]
MGHRIPQSNIPSSVADEAITKEMHDGLERATTIASSLEANSDGGLGCHITMGDSPVQARPERLSNFPNKPPIGEGNVTALEIKLKSIKDIYNKALITLTKRVKKLEKNLKHKRRRAFLDSSEDEEASLDQENSPKQRRMIEEINEDENTNLAKSSKKGEAHETTSTVSPQKDNVEEPLAKTLVSIKKSATKDKEYTQHVQAQWVSDEARIAQENIAQAKQWDDVQAQIQANEDLAQKMLEEERENMFIKERSILLTEFIDKRKKMLAKKRAEEKRNKPPTQAQHRTYMSNYIKNMGGYTLKQLKQYSFEEIKMLFDQTMESIRNFVPMECEGQMADFKAGEGSSKEGESLKRPNEEELGQEHQKKQLFNEKYASTRPGFDDLMPWGDMKIMFEPDGDDAVRKNHKTQELCKTRNK